ncbi:MAG: hypothetical protein AB8F94_22415 [Saprospiraceae bacterium]
MSKLFKLSFLFAIIALLMTSCNDDNVLQDNNVTPNPPVITQNQQQINSLVTSDSAGCYEIVFPITFIMDDGTSVTVDSELDLEDIFAAPPYPVNLGFPVNLTDPVTGENVTANDETELGTFLSECDFGPGPGIGVCDSLDIELGFIGCYDLEYPVSFVLEDGSTATANSVDDLNTIFDPTNPPVDFAYPLNLTNLDTGDSATANNEDELNDLLLLCDGFGGGGPGTGGGICDSLNFDLGFIGCYDLVYPVSFTLQDGSVATANSSDDLLNIFTNSNPPVDFAYPLNLTNLDTGAAATANSETELGDLLLLCDGFGGGGPGTGGGICDSLNFDLGFIGCYDLVYPVSFTLQDGSTATANSSDELPTIFTNNNPPVDFAYPLNLINISNGAAATANSEAELGDLLLLCGNIGGGGSGGGNWGQSIVYPMTIITAVPDSTGFPSCYDYQYPVSVVDVDGNVLTASDDDSMMGIVFGAIEIEDFVYPVNVTETSTGQILTANDEDDVIAWLDDCN